VPGALEELTNAVALLADEPRAVQLAAHAMYEACGRGLALAMTSRGPRSERLGHMALVFEGAPVKLETSHLAYVRTPAYDVAQVPLPQRNRWVEPFREGIATREGFKSSTLYPFVARFGVLDQGRVAICSGERQVALVGAAVPEGTEITEAERARLREVGAALVAPLRIAALVAASQAGTPLERALAAKEESVIALDARGGIVDASRAAYELLRRDRALPERLAKAIAGLGRPRAVVQSGEHVVHVTPYEDDRAVAFLAVVDGGEFAEVPPVLTARQSEVLRLLERGLTNAEIAQALGNAPSTVKTILERLYERTATSNRVELLAWWRARAER
jgi:DNA-binding NarL/FixJ family response regulator